MDQSALIVVDVQYDFLSNGALPVPNGESTISVINALLAREDHVSFVSNHEGDKSEVEITWNGETQTQVLWPVHCVQGTRGCELHEDLALDRIDRVFQKGYNSHLDSYSGFADSFNHEQTGLDFYLKDRGIQQVFIVGLAEDYCVFQTALAAGRLGYKTNIVREAVAGISSLTAAQSEQLSRHGVSYVNVSSILD